MISTNNIPVINSITSQVFFKQTEETTTVTLNDICVIQCFYGIDVNRIKSTATALSYMLQSTYIPKNWIFIEAQKSKDDCSFKWLKHYGIKYQFIEINEEQSITPLKMALWNIGTTMSNEENICFIDSDIMYCNPEWLLQIDNQFKIFDVISPFSEAYHSEDEHLIKYSSVGHEWINEHSIENGHFGFSLGMKRHVFKRLNGFDPIPGFDDIWNILRILGKNIGNPFLEFIPCDLPKIDEYGHNVDFGYANETIFHIDHNGSNTKYLKMVDALKNRINAIDDVISYDKNDFLTLPIYRNNTFFQKAIRIACPNMHICPNDISGEEFLFNIGKSIEEPNSKKPIIFITELKDEFGQSLGGIHHLNECLKHTMKFPFQFLAYVGNGIDCDDQFMIKKSFNSFNEYLHDIKSLGFEDCIVIYVPLNSEVIEMDYILNPNYNTIYKSNNNGILIANTSNMTENPIIDRIEKICLMKNPQN